MVISESKKSNSFQSDKTKIKLFGNAMNCFGIFAIVRALLCSEQDDYHRRTENCRIFVVFFLSFKSIETE